MILYSCPSDNRYACSWEGSSNDILGHFIEEHEELISSNTVEVDLSVPSENRLLFIEEEIYLFQSKIDQSYLTICLRYLGPAMLASKTTYDLKIRSNTCALTQEQVTVTSEGIIRVNLKNLRDFIRDLQILTCSLEISGDFRSCSSDDGVFFEDDINSEKNDSFSIKSPRNSITRYQSFDEGSLRSFENLDTLSEEPRKNSSLCRSKTINFEKRTHVKRCPSTVSLQSIPESDMEINCANCDVILVPPIYICPSKHNFCSKCSSSICKLCVEKITEERNFELEEKCINYLHPCRNYKHGCTRRLTLKELQEHEIKCKYCEYKCPIQECGFVGPFKNIVKHLKLIHSSVKIFESFIVVFQKNPEAFLLNEDKGVFYCFYKILSDSVLWEAKFCGPKEKRFFCELKFKERNLKTPLLLTKDDDTYSIELSFQELKSLKVKSKNSILTITC